jgi:hypothetical protein
MRALGLFAFLILLLSTAVFAQHTAPMPPPAVNTTATVSHAPMTTPAVTHTDVAAAHVSAPHEVASTSHSVASTTHAATAKTNEARISTAKPNPEKRGLFSWLRKHEPVGTKLPDRSKERVNPIPDYLAMQTMPTAPHAHHRCMIVPIWNPAIPCNPYAPCCD